MKEMRIGTRELVIEEGEEAGEEVEEEAKGDLVDHLAHFSLLFRPYYQILSGNYFFLNLCSFECHFEGADC